MKRRKLPPYGRPLSAKIKRGENVEPYVYAGPFAWPEGNWHSQYIGQGTALVLPPEDDADDYRWPVRNLCVHVFWTDEDKAAGEELTKLASCLIRGGAIRVVARSWFGEYISARPSVRRTAA